jgi:hypothetical protein
VPSPLICASASLSFSLPLIAIELFPLLHLTVSLSLSLILTVNGPQVVERALASNCQLVLRRLIRGAAGHGTLEGGKCVGKQPHLRESIIMCINSTCA